MKKNIFILALLLFSSCSLIVHTFPYQEVTWEQFKKIIGPEDVLTLGASEKYGYMFYIVNYQKKFNKKFKVNIETTPEEDRIYMRRYTKEVQRIMAKINNRNIK